MAQEFPTDETYSQEGPKCPHCGYQITADDPGYYRESYEADTCPSCDKAFKVEVTHSVSWTCTPQAAG